MPPSSRGDVVGTVELKLAGETIGVVDLIAGQDVSPEPAAVHGGPVPGVSGQSVPQSCNNIEYYFHHHLLCVGPFEQLEPPQAHQKRSAAAELCTVQPHFVEKEQKPRQPFQDDGAFGCASSESNPTMGESKSPALPLGDGASCKILYHILCFSTREGSTFSAFAARCRLFAACNL